MADNHKLACLCSVKLNADVRIRTKNDAEGFSRSHSSTVDLIGWSWRW